MSAVLKALNADMKKKQDRIDLLDGLMHKDHLSKEDARLMDDFSRRFNASSSITERANIIAQNSALMKRWDDAVKKSIHQTDNYMKWSEEHLKLRLECDELGQEIARIEFRDSLSNRKQL